MSTAPTHTMSEQEISISEAQFPTRAREAFAQARERVLESGQSVLQTRADIIYEVFPDGRKVPVKRIHPPQATIPGTILIIPAKAQ